MVKIEWITNKKCLKPILLIHSHFLQGERITCCRTFNDPIDLHYLYIIFEANTSFIKDITKSLDLFSTPQNSDFFTIQSNKKRYIN